MTGWESALDLADLTDPTTEHETENVMSYRPGKYLADLNQAAADLALDTRTTEQIAADDYAYEESLREVLTGLPARPGVTR